jgi:hypothetical protein
VKMDQAFFSYLQSVSRYSSTEEIEIICFRALIDSYQRVKQIRGIAKLTENKIRDRFVIDLEENNQLIENALEESIIRIVPERYNPVKKKRSDIEFFLPCSSLIFECKKLSSADRRYLNEGLARFIKLEYAAKEDRAGMIGFVIKSKDPSGMIARLSKKVRAFRCSALIDKPIFGHPHSFQSIHIRVDSRDIIISHLFFKF